MTDPSDELSEETVDPSEIETVDGLFDVRTPQKHSEAALRAGDVLDGVYHIKRGLSEGGMGEVYLAKDQKLGRNVAIKVIQASKASPELLRMFEKEARATAALSHPNIITIHNIGRWKGLPYIVLERLEGETLSAKLKTEQLTVDAVLDIMLQVAQALEYAHNAGVIHRDLKPSNIFLNEEGQLKVLDFGLAEFQERDLNTTWSELTPEERNRLMEPGALGAGTPPYMAPEQWRGWTQDARTDVWAMGVLFFHLLTRQFPYGFGPTLVFDDSLPPTPQSLNPNVSDALDALVRKALAKKPQDRFANAGELRAELERIERASTTSVETAVSAQTTTPKPAPPPNTPPSSSGVLPRVGALVVGITAVVALLWWAVVWRGGGSRTLQPENTAQSNTSALDAASRQPDASQSTQTPAVPDVEEQETKLAVPEKEPLKPVSILAEGHTTYALMNNGEVRGWGSNYRWSLGGDLPEVDTAIPVVVKDLPGRAEALFSGRVNGEYETTTCARLENGEVWCWGQAGWGLPVLESAKRMRPTPAVSWSHAQDMDWHFSFLGLVLPDGTIQNWGRNSPALSGWNPVLRPIEGFDEIPMAQIRAGKTHVCALSQDGRVWCWGKGEYHQVVPGRNTYSNEPVQVEGLTHVVAIGAANFFSCALQKDGRLWCWGSWFPEGLHLLGQDVISFDVGDNRGCFITKHHHTLCFGSDVRGRIGATHTSYGVPILVDSTRGLKPKAIEVGFEHNCLLTESDEVYCWGSNTHGQLGDGTLVDRLEAKAVLHLNDVELPHPESGDDTLDADFARSAQDFSNAPPPCPRNANTLAVQHPGIAAKTIDVRFGFAKTLTGQRNTLTLANYDRERFLRHDLTYAWPRGRSLRVEVAFFDSTDHPFQLVVGRYPTSSVWSGHTSFWSHVQIVGRYAQVFPDWDTETLSPESHVNITHLDAIWICGNIYVEGKWGHIKGAFAVKHQVEPSE